MPLILYLSGIILAFFFSLLLLSKKDKSQADYILLAWLCFSGLHILGFFSIYSKIEGLDPSYRSLGFSLPLVHGPFLYLYTIQNTSSIKFKAKRLLHFLPFFLSILLFSRFHFFTLEEKNIVFLNKGKGFETELLLNQIAITSSGVFYTIISLIKLLKYRKNMLNQFSNTEKINFNWLLYMIFWIMAIWVIVLFVKNENMIFAFASMFVLWIGYFGTKQVKVFSQNTIDEYDENLILKSDEKPESEVFSNSTYIKYQKSLLSENEANEIHNNLINLLKDQKPYKNPELTLNQLAQMLNIHPNHLSQVINTKENKNFYELINERRIIEFIELSKQPIIQQYTMLALAMDCGFNSKASFNRNFKSYTGLTPRDFLKQKENS